MQIEYKAGGKTYWLKPQWSEDKIGRVRILGAKLFNAEGRHLGWWEYPTWPTELKRRVRTDVLGWVKDYRRRAKYQAIHSDDTSWLE